MQDFGIVGCLLNPHPSEALEWTQHAELCVRYWRPWQYEKLVQLDVPGYVHAARLPLYSWQSQISMNFINEETYWWSFASGSSWVFKDF